MATAIPLVTLGKAGMVGLSAETTIDRLLEKADQFRFLPLSSPGSSVSTRTTRNSHPAGTPSRFGSDAAGNPPAVRARHPTFCFPTSDFRLPTTAYPFQKAPHQSDHPSNPHTPTFPEVIPEA